MWGGLVREIIPCAAPIWGLWALVVTAHGTGKKPVNAMHNDGNGKWDDESGKLNCEMVDVERRGCGRDQERIFRREREGSPPVVISEVKEKYVT